VWAWGAAAVRITFLSTCLQCYEVYSLCSEEGFLGQITFTGGDNFKDELGDKSFQAITCTGSNKQQESLAIAKTTA